MKIKPKTIEKPSCMIDLLYWLTVFGALSRQYLLTLANNSNYMYRVLQEAKDEGLITEKEIHSGSKRDKPITYYFVTAKGIDVLSRSYDALPEPASWVRYLIPPQKVVVSREGSTNERAERYISIAGMAFIAALIGAKTDVMSFEKQLSEVKKRVVQRGSVPNTTSALVAAALNEQNKTEGIKNDHLSLTQSDIVYHDAFVVKGSISNRLLNAEKLVRIGRYTGFLESPVISVLTFIGDKEGMTWSKYFYEAEGKAYRCFCTSYSVYKENPRDTQGYVNAIMMVSNAKMFADLFLDTKKARTKEKFAEQYASFHVFPISRQGVALLERFMHKRYEDIEQEIAKFAMDYWSFSGPEKAYSRLFPITDPDGMPIMIGALINTTKLNQLLAVVEKTGLKYGILCYEWEMDYYWRVCGDVECYPLPEDV